MNVDPAVNEREVRTLFVSDVHLGFRHAQPLQFQTFLMQFRPEKLYILGDFFDGWKLRASWRWKPVYNHIVNRLLTLAREGTELYYTPGNHDAFLRRAEVRAIIANAGVNVRMEDEFVFQARDGRRFLAMHGDKFDLVERRYQWLSHASSLAYEPLLSLNWLTNRVMRRRNRSPYAMCAVVKRKVKGAVRFVSRFERALFEYARSKDCHGVICGHIHRPGVVYSGSMTYFNTGDWVENCTALVEELDGTIRLEAFFPHVRSRIVYPPRIPDNWDDSAPETYPSVVAGALPSGGRIEAL